MLYIYNFYKFFNIYFSYNPFNTFNIYMPAVNIVSESYVYRLHSSTYIYTQYSLLVYLLFYSFSNIYQVLDGICNTYVVIS